MKRKQPRFVPSGRENTAPSIRDSGKKNLSLKKSAEKAATLIRQQIEASQQSINEMVNEMARHQNKIEKLRLGFHTKLRARQDSLASNNLERIADIQSMVSIHLAESEKLAQQIATLTAEITDTTKTKEVQSEYTGKVDFSSKTQKLLSVREDELRKKCSEEFAPLFDQLQTEHITMIQMLNDQHSKDLIEIEAEADREIASFVPRAYITKQEVRVRQEFEAKQQHDKMEYEKRREILKSQISEIETARDREMQRITNETDEQIFHDEQLFNARLREVKSSVIAPKIQKAPMKVELSTAQEEEIRRKTELGLRATFENRIKVIVAEIAVQQEAMEAELAQILEEKLIEAGKLSEQAIQTCECDLPALESEIERTREEIETLKGDWTDLNHNRRDYADMLSKLESSNLRMEERLSELDGMMKELAEEGDPIDDSEVDAIQEELTALGKEVTATRRYHVRSIAKAAANHNQSMQEIKARVKNLSDGKDELIIKLKAQLRETKKKSKEVREELQRKIGTYGP
jgi:hypothetical protein